MGDGGLVRIGDWNTLNNGVRKLLRDMPGAEAQVVSAARTQAEQEQRTINQHVS